MLQADYCAEYEITSILQSRGKKFVPLYTLQILPKNQNKGIFNEHAGCCMQDVLSQTLLINCALLNLMQVFCLSCVLSPFESLVKSTETCSEKMHTIETVSLLNLTNIFVVYIA